MVTADLLNTALQEHQAGRLAAAIAGYRQVLVQLPGEPDALHLLGIALMQSGRPAEAVPLIEQAIERAVAVAGGAAQPQHAPLYGNLGNALQACGRADAALENFRRSVALAPGMADLQVNLGNALQMRGQPGAAIEAYRAALATRPDHADGLLNLGNAQVALGQLEPAIESYRTVVRLRPGHASALNNLGNALLSAGRAGEGIEALHAAAAADPRSIDIAVNLASALNAAGQVDAAIARYRALIAAHPGAATAHYNLANALIARGDRAGAITGYEHAVAANPDYAEAHYNLAKLRHEQGDLQGAEDGYRRALAMRPQQGSAIFNLGNLLVERGRFTEATALLRRLGELEPGNAQAACLLGMAQRGDQKLDDAVASYQRAIALDATFPEPHYNMAQVLAECGRPEPAIAAFEAAIALKPGYGEAHRGLGNLLQSVGRDADATACFVRSLGVQPLITRRAAGGRPTFSVLLLIAPGRGNTPIDWLTRDAPYDSHILLFLPEHAYDIAFLREHADVVFNLISDVDLGSELLPAVAALIERLGLPVVNPPERIRPTDRFSIARTLRDLPHAVVPETVRYARAALETPQGARAVAVEPPLLLRPAGSHGGEDMELVDDRDAIPALVAAAAHPAFYVTRFVDYRSADGYFRKYRLIFIGDQILPYHLAMTEAWKVHYYRTEMVNHAWMREEEARFLNDAGAAFSPDLLAALEAIRATIGLDFFGIDCGIDRDGRLVMFEVNASMLVHADEPEPVFAYKQAPVARIKQAFDAMLARAAGVTEHGAT